MSMFDKIKDAALRDAAQNEGDDSEPGADFAVDNQLVNVFGSEQNQQGGQQIVQPQAQMISCPTCGKMNASGAKFCADCGAKMETAAASSSSSSCVKCGAELREGAKFCSECGAKQEKTKCANCQAELATGAKFCAECGTKTEQAN